ALNEAFIDAFFEATAELTQEAVLNSMLCSNDFEGFLGRKRLSLRNALERPV
ncbi:P1 family peptidase, partial [Cribrihabitans sp. XS_ASV171]